MQGHHWFMLVVVALVFYAIGARYPTTVPFLGTG